MISRKRKANPWSDFCVTEKAAIGAPKAKAVSTETPIMPSAPVGLVAIPVTRRTPAKKAAAKATFPTMKAIAPTMTSAALRGVATMA